jgi:hypothetical protein
MGLLDRHYLQIEVEGAPARLAGGYEQIAHSAGRDRFYEDVVTRALGSPASLNNEESLAARLVIKVAANDFYDRFRKRDSGSYTLSAANQTDLIGPESKCADERLGTNQRRRQKR